MAMKCKVDNCDREANCRGWCKTHYTRWTRTGDPLISRVRRYNGETCSVSGCGGKIKENYLCSKHAQRVRRYGDVNYTTPESIRIENNRAAQPKLRKAKSTTYLKLFGRHEHRVVAEKTLGRKLESGEIVHHKDGNKHNNTPDNLEVMTQSEHIREHHAEMMTAARKKK